MADLDDRTRSDLACLRDQRAPSSSAKQRMLEGLEARLDPGGGDDPSGGSGDGSVAWAAKVVGATVGLTGAGLLALRVGAELVRALAAAPQPPAVEQQPVEVAAAPVEVEPVRAEAAPIIEPEPEPTPTIEPRDAAAPRGSSAATPSRAASKTENTLAAELALLEAAHAARDPAAALVALERHLARFPHGELADERELLRIEALCRLGQLTDARVLTERFLRERPNSALKRRLASMCPALAPSQKIATSGTDDTRAGHVGAR